MINLIIWEAQELEVLAKMDISFAYKGQLTDAQMEDLYEIVPDYMLSNTDTGDDSPNSEFSICENITTKLAIHLRARGLLG